MRRLTYKYIEFNLLKSIKDILQRKYEVRRSSDNMQYFFVPLGAADFENRLVRWPANLLLWMLPLQAM
jgi:hypothetical protein